MFSWYVARVLLLLLLVVVLILLLLLIVHIPDFAAVQPVLKTVPVSLSKYFLFTVLPQCF